MATSVRRALAALLTIMIVLVAQSPRTTEAISSCHLSCLLACFGHSFYTYPACLGSCLLLACKGHPPVADNPLMHCNSGCVMSTCMDHNKGDNDEKTKQCVISCSDGCEKAYFKSLY